MPRTWFITGTSSGFGRLLTEQLLARGDRVAATLRRPAARPPTPYFSFYIASLTARLAELEQQREVAFSVVSEAARPRR
jgi:NAD(P)-dependent dehydrogenase (short-subunit alcohol dehydrogenase family)